MFFIYKFSFSLGKESSAKSAYPVIFPGFFPLKFMETFDVWFRLDCLPNKPIVSAWFM